jgi:hypothetical protein
MSMNDAIIRISADISALMEALSRAVAGVKSSVGEMKESFEGLLSAFEKVNAIMAGVTAALAGGAAFKEAIDKTVDLTKEANMLARALGVSATEASVMNIALGDIYQSGDTVVAATGKITKTLLTNEDAFKSLGVATRDQNGNFRNSMDIMLDTNEALSKFREGTDRNVEGTKIYGKSWQEVAPLLKLNNELIEESRQKADALGLTIGQEGVESVAKYRAAMNDVGDVMDGLKKAVGDVVMPIMTEFANEMSTEGPDSVSYMRVAVAGVSSVLLGLKMAAEIAWEGIKLFVQQSVNYFMRFADASSKALQLDFSGAIRAWKSGTEIIEETNNASMDRIVKKAETARNLIFGAWDNALNHRTTPTQRATGGQASDGADDKEKDKKAPAEKSRMGEWEARLNEEKVYYQQSNDLREYSKKQELAYWKNILDTVQVSDTERLAIRQKTANLELEIIKKNIQQQRALDAEKISNTEAIANDALRADEEAAQQQLAAGAITNAQFLAMQQAFEDRRTDIAQTAQAARIQAMLGDPNHDPVALQKLLDQMEQIQRNHALKVQQINGQMAADSRKTWEDMFKPMTDAVEKSVTGIITGTTTLKKALSNIFQSIVSEFVSSTVKKMVSSWAAGEAQKTLASQIGAAQQTAAQVAGSATAMSTKATEATAVIGSNAGEAASGAASAVASIPIIGPALAAASFSSVMAMVMGALGSVKSAEGGFDIPAGVNPLTQLHQREMVLPAEHADTIRGLAGGGSAGGVHLYVNAVDAHSVRRLFANNGAALAETLRRQARNFTPVRA